MIIYKCMIYHPDRRCLIMKLKEYKMLFMELIKYINEEVHVID